MTSTEFENYAAVNNELPTEEKISKTDIITKLEKSHVALVKAMILKTTILGLILSLENIGKFIELNS
ncbi:hypothetical protein HZS_557 [Henneguya salminicola]|nr:hypothetical protein HZS_557 [Henneguya salminicola]